MAPAPRDIAVAYNGWRGARKKTYYCWRQSTAKAITARGISAPAWQNIEK